MLPLLYFQNKTNDQTHILLFIKIIWHGVKYPNWLRNL